MGESAPISAAQEPTAAEVGQMHKWAIECVFALARLQREANSVKNSNLSNDDAVERLRDCLGALARVLIAKPARHPSDSIALTNAIDANKRYAGQSGENYHAITIQFAIGVLACTIAHGIGPLSKEVLKDAMANWDSAYRRITPEFSYAGWDEVRTQLHQFNAAGLRARLKRERAAAIKGLMAAEPGGGAEPVARKSRAKRSTQPGEAQAKILAALIAHHAPDGNSCLNWEPLGVNELAGPKWAAVSAGSVTGFFNREFGREEKNGHSRYKSMCQQKQPAMPRKLLALNGEAQQHENYGSEVPTARLDRRPRLRNSPDDVD